MLHHFYPTGRISRWPYFWRVPALYLLAFICYGLPRFAEYQLNDTAAHWRNIAFAGIVFCFYMVVVQGVKRLHDLDLRGWWLLFILVPLVSIGLGSALAFVSGTAGPNRFGPSPSQPATPPFALA
ncbi:DUF805 domain-containing protein [Hymenobacter setariae]|uniref:DUF805 domain-containing protein n=1 Tax=Hymenobacter setariae TaxID=2594794 RepID=A0A558BU61_9BACT|nr:DUF805 domain-containing protein [Hymenobacter setariae]TVT40060.1 DUF805 domain-containing protein [Hymenobacter setariae]